jgi:hypothetical protein
MYQVNINNGLITNLLWYACQIKENNSVKKSRGLHESVLTIWKTRFIETLLNVDPSRLEPNR